VEETAEEEEMGETAEEEITVEEEEESTTIAEEEEIGDEEDVPYPMELSLGEKMINTLVKISGLLNEFLTSDC
jgi:hypothetical protein